MSSPTSLTIEPTYKQHLGWQILNDNETEEFLFGGGAGGGKSWLGCEWLISMCLRYPGTRYFIARKRLKILKQTTLITFFKVCRHHNLKRDAHYHYKEQQSVIEFYNGSVIDLLEVDYRPSDPDYEDLGSSEYTSGWIEEASEVVFGAFDTLTVRVNRQLNDKYGILGKVFITCNPKKNWLYKLFYKLWKAGTLPKNRKFLQSLVGDNPKNESGYKQKLIGLKNQAKKQRLLYGNWEYDDDPATLINFEAISDLLTNTVETKEKYMTVDVARFGEDKTVLTLWKGMEIYKVIIRSKQATNVTTDLIRTQASNEKIPYSNIAIDEDGVGGGVVDNLMGVRGFIANSSPLEDIRVNKDTEEKPNYRNLKTQCSYMLAEEINNHRIAVKPIVVADEDIDYDELLTEDLEQIKAKDPDSDETKLNIIPKDDVKEAIGRSPDYGDCLMMRMIFFLRLPNIINNEKVKINTASWVGTRWK
ncbi:MAG: phage portal protein [Bacteroidetes bacterium]|nr:phage portal protein [Bacteroidota bacterium]